MQQFISSKLNFTVDFLETLGSKVIRRADSQMGAKRESKHESISEVETFAFELAHESQENGGNVLELGHEKEVVRVH